MLKIFKHMALLTALSLFSSGLAIAKETAGEKTKNAAKAGWKDTKQTYRNTKAEIICKADDKKCLEAKAKAKLKNAGDEVNQKADELEDKIDD